MKYLYSWLKDYYPDIPPLDSLESLLVQLGHDVESITPLSREGLIVGKIKTIEWHPNASRLSCLMVDDGTNDRPIVCGASNLKVNQKVVLACPGTKLPSGITIQTTSIRGEQSEGMLCSSQELGINISSNELHVLPEDSHVGSLADSYLPADAVITLDITSDRGDVLSHFGLARDIYAAQENAVLQFDFQIPPSYETGSSIQLEAIHPDCQAISFALVTSTTPSATPVLWKSRLALLGQKSINLPTDLTNYIMLAFGQPLHAYNAGKLGSYQFGVRRAHEGERFSTLQSKELRLTQQNLVVTADDNPIALAGVIGSDQTSTTPNSHQIMFEAADFVPKSISLSARGLNLLTDAALRFERQIDREARQKIFNHALALWCHLSGGQILATSSTQSSQTKQIEFACDLDELIDFIGSPIPYHQLQTLFESVGCTVTLNTPKNWNIHVPSWRHDLVHLEDFAEEIIRLVDINKLVKKPLTPSVPQWKRSQYWQNEFLKDTLVAIGLTEVQTYPFVALDEMKLLGVDEQKSLMLSEVPIQNKQFLRPNLTPSLLATVASNPETPHLSLFEIAKIYTTEKEFDHIGIVIAGNSQSQIDKEWQNLFERLRLPVSSWMSRINTIGPDVLKHYKIRKPHVTLLEMPVHEFNQTKTFDILPVTIPELDTIEVQTISQYQTSRRDVSLIVATGIDAYKLAGDILRWGKTLNIIETRVFDIYRDPSIGNDKQSIAIRITFQAPDRTLTQPELNQYQEKLNQYLTETYHAIIR